MWTLSAVDSGDAGGARAPLEFGGSEKGRSQISAYRSLAITMNTPGFKKQSTALQSLIRTTRVSCLGSSTIFQTFTSSCMMV